MRSIPSFSPSRTVVTNFSASRKVEDAYDDGVWVLDVCCDGPNKKWFGCALSNGTIQIYDYNRLQLSHSYTNIYEGIGTITDLATDSENLIVSSSSDGSISIFDIRQQLKPTLRFNVSSNNNNNEQALSVDLGFNGTVAVVGSSKAKIHFFDLRSGSGAGKLLGSYNDAHIEEVTRVRFRPSSSWLVSASEDGLACIFDVSQPSEDAALQGVLNVQSPLRKVGFFGPSYEGVYCLTGSETLSVWHHDTAQRICDFGENLRGDLTGLLSQKKKTVDYLVDCYWSSENQQLTLLTGNHNGDGAVFHVEAGRITPMHLLKNGHKGDIRACCHISPDIFATVGEDARLCEWNRSTATNTTATNENTSSKKGGAPARRSKSKSSNSNNPY